MRIKHLVIAAVAIIACASWVLAQWWASDVEVQEEITPPAQTEESGQP